MQFDKIAYTALGLCLALAILSVRQCSSIRDLKQEASNQAELSWQQLDSLRAYRERPVQIDTFIFYEEVIKEVASSAPTVIYRDRVVREIVPEVRIDTVLRPIVTEVYVDRTDSSELDRLYVYEDTIYSQQTTLSYRIEALGTLLSFEPKITSRPPDILKKMPIRALEIGAGMDWSLPEGNATSYRLGAGYISDGWSLRYSYGVRPGLPNTHGLTYGRVFKLK